MAIVYGSNLIPIMTSSTTPNGQVTASTQVNNDAWKAFNSNTNDGWNTATYTTTGWLAYEFLSPVVVDVYTIVALTDNRGPKDFTFEGWNGGTWVVLDTRTNITNYSKKLEFSFSNSTAYIKYRINVSVNNGFATFLGINELTMHQQFHYKYNILTKISNKYIKYSSSSWQTITTSEPIEADYLQGNTLDELSQIPESAWQELTGPVELCYYTDNPEVTEAQFNIETEPFTLADEFEGESISIIEYTDNPNQTESTVTLETEPFTFYDEMGDSFDVLYYTDDPAKTSAELEINANYTPLDEIEEDFEVVTWTNKEVQDVTEKLVTTPKTDVIEDGALHGTVVDLTQGTGVKKIK